MLKIDLETGKLSLGMKPSYFGEEQDDDAVQRPGKKAKSEALPDIDGEAADMEADEYEDVAKDVESEDGDEDEKDEEEGPGDGVDDISEDDDNDDDDDDMEGCDDEEEEDKETDELRDRLGKSWDTIDDRLKRVILRL